MVGTPASRVRYNAEAPEVAQLKQVHSAKDEIIMLLTLLPHLCVCFAIIFMGNSRVRGGSVTFFQGEESYLAAQKRWGSGRPSQKVSLDPSGREMPFRRTAASRKLWNHKLHRRRSILWRSSLVSESAQDWNWRYEHVVKEGCEFSGWNFTIFESFFEF